MSSLDKTPPMRTAPCEPIDSLIRRFDREKRAELVQREDRLDASLAPFRVGSVPYLNSVPLTKGLEDQVSFLPPSELAVKLRADELDAALVSVTEVLLNDRYDVLDGIAVASSGEVRSVFLAHRGPISDAKEIFCDRASLTSVCLLRVLLAERGVKPVFKLLNDYTMDPMPDYFLLIGNPAIEFLRRGHTHQIWDLGSAWFELTRLPFVYAVWALRRGIENDRLRVLLREAYRFGMESLENTIRNLPDFDYDFRRDYLGWHIHYHLGADEKRGLSRFGELIEQHGQGAVFPPQFLA